MTVCTTMMVTVEYQDFRRHRACVNLTRSVTCHTVPVLLPQQLFQNMYNTYRILHTEELRT